MIEIKVKNGEGKVNMRGSAGEIFSELYSVLERFAIILKEDDSGTECYSEFCRILRAIADGKTKEEYAAKLLKELKDFS